MNRIIVIGNGFDKAHGLATGYKDFIDSYWDEFSWRIWGWRQRQSAKDYGLIATPDSYEDGFASFEVFRIKSDMAFMPSLPQQCSNPYGEIIEFFTELNSYEHEQDEDFEECNFTGSVRLTFKNKFFGHISGRCSLTNWVDIENEYYEKLKELLEEKDTDVRRQKVQELNQDFDAVKKLLEMYLSKIVEETDFEMVPSVKDVFKRLIEPEEIAHGKQGAFFKSIVDILSMTGNDDDMQQTIENDDYIFLSEEESVRLYIQNKLKTDEFKEQYCRPAETLILNFNYTDIAERLYGEDSNEVIHIHGKLNDKQNPIIFGYGDELDDDYKRIEKLQDNDFLENIKSIRYHETGSYRRLLEFLEAGLYQVVTMGHACGNSDRTLLNTLLEHPNCASVKVCYHQREDGTDNYSQLVRNLSRNFNDKAAMRDKIVNKGLCIPLIPIKGNRRSQ